MIEIFSDPEGLSRGAAELFSAEAQRAQAAHGRFSVLLSGGETPRRTYELLAEEPLRSRIPWQGVHLFWGDERCVAPTDPRSNLHMARQALLDRLSLPPVQIHPMSGDMPPLQAATAYDGELRRYFAGKEPRFDLVLLGLGEDGHTASLFPGSPSLDEQVQWTAVTQRAGEEIQRITVTAPLINQAALVVFLVAGAAKAETLRRVLEGPADPSELPAQLIRPVNGRICWLVDRAAARLLRS